MNTLPVAPDVLVHTVGSRAIVKLAPIPMSRSAALHHMSNRDTARAT
jgi:hypothetical protein